MKRRIYFNGRILTMNDAQPQADYVVTEGGRVVELGDASGIEGHLTRGAEPVDLRGGLMLPGFIDSHIHMLTAALNRFKLDISAMRFDSVEDMLAYVKKEKAHSGDPWISVFGFSEENMGDGRMVTRLDIDRVFPDVPVTVIRVCGHICIINTQAIARLDREKMENIRDGAFKKDERGAYTGLATEGAQQYVLDSMPGADEEALLDCLDREQELLLKNGITAIHDAGTDMMQPRAYVELYEEMERRGRLKIRTYLMVRPGEDEPFEDFNRYLHALKAAHPSGGRLAIGSVKLFADGSLGGRTAAVTQAYEGEPDNTGLLLNARLDEYAKAAADAGHQVAVHAIGDRAVGYVADIYVSSRMKAQSRLRLEHAELLSGGLMEIIRQNEFLIMTQPIFIREFGSTYFNNLGRERAMCIQPLGTLLKKGITVGFGTDYPVDDPNPLLGIHAAMTRRIKDTDRLLGEEESIRFCEAVKCYTLNNAYGAFCEEVMGSIEEGKYADFVVLSGLTADTDGAVKDVAAGVVEMTVIEGEAVYVRKN